MVSSFRLGLYSLLLRSLDMRSVTIFNRVRRLQCPSRNRTCRCRDRIMVRDSVRVRWQIRQFPGGPQSDSHGPRFHKPPCDPGRSVFPSPVLTSAPQVVFRWPAFPWTCRLKHWHASAYIIHGLLTTSFRRTDRYGSNSEFGYRCHHETAERPEPPLPVSGSGPAGGRETRRLPGGRDRRPPRGGPARCSGRRVVCWRSLGQGQPILSAFSRNMSPFQENDHVQSPCPLTSSSEILHLAGPIVLA